MTDNKKQAVLLMPMERDPFFILGVPRSGTTMLRLMLNCHPNIAVPHETGFFTEFRRRLDQYGDLSETAARERLIADVCKHHFVSAGHLIRDPECLLRYPAESYSELIDAIMTDYAGRQGKTRWGDKTPSYTADIDVIWSLFPGCKFIHLVRDGRDVVLSQSKIEWMSRHLPRLAEGWRWGTMICHKVGSVLGPKYYCEVRFEDLVRDPEQVLQDLCIFLNETYDPQMLEYFKTARNTVPPGSLKWHESSINPPNSSKALAWKTQMSRADRIIFEENASDALDLFGYELERNPSTLASKIKNFYYAAVVRY